MSQDTTPAISVSSARREKRRSRRVGEGRTETKVLNLARCDIPEKNNTASPNSCNEWRKTERDIIGGRGDDDPVHFRGPHTPKRTQLETIG